MLDEKIVAEGQNIVLSVFQPRDVNPESTDPEVKVLSKAALTDSLT